jgi:urease accessory protein
VGQQRLAILQLCDSLFPVGSFAHSDGLETAVVDGRVAASADLRDWMETVLDVALRGVEAPAVRDAFAAALSGDFATLARIDGEVEAMRPSAAGREATRTMGTRLLRTWQQIRPSSITEAVLAARQRCTFPVAFAVVCAASGIERGESIEAYCYTRLAATVSAAMRLMKIGQHESHALLADMLGRVPRCVDDVLNDAAPPRAFMPLMDIATMSHQFVHSRLFRS